MVNEIANEVKLFKGIKNDENQKQIEFEYFYKCKNFNYPNTGILGMDKILCPEPIIQIGTSSIDGFYEYRFLDSNNQLQKQNIVVTNGCIYKTDLVNTNTLLKSGLYTGLCSFQVFNDKLYIANGKNYVQVYDGNKGIVSEMGAPISELSTAVGNLNGSYYYAITYVTAGGEEVIGSIGNTVVASNNKVLLTLPLGYTGTLNRNIYRTVAGGTQLKLVANIANNTDLTYLDNISDGSLGVDIPTNLNNELPKPYFLSVANQKIFGAVVDKYPTQVFITDTNKDIFDLGSGLDVADYGADSTPVKGIGTDFNKIVVGTEKNIIFINPDDNTVVFTRANIGIKNGYTLTNVPAFAGFPGGLMFVSSLNDVRLMNGLQALPVSTSIDNVRTENWAQNIRGSLEIDLKVTTNLYAAFFDYKYHLVVNFTKYVFDIRTNGWTYHDISTENYQSQPLILSILGNNLYNGQPDGWIEQEYLKIQYKNEDVEAYVESGYMDANNKYKFVNKMMFWFVPSKENEVEIEVTTDDNTSFSASNVFKVAGGVFNPQFYDNFYFLTDTKGMDYRIVNINKNCRWIKYKLTNTVGNISFQGFSIFGQQLKNKE